MARPKLIKKNQWYRILNGKQTKYTHLHWRVKTNASHLSTQLVYTGTHIAWMLRHNDAVIFIKIEHSFFTAKLAQPHAWRKSACFGWLRRCSVCRTFFSCKKGIRVVRVPSCFCYVGSDYRRILPRPSFFIMLLGLALVILCIILLMSLNCLMRRFTS